MTDVLVDDNKRWNKVHVLIRDLHDGNKQGYLLCDNTPYLVWYHVYTNLGMEESHARRVKDRLIEEMHYIRVTKRELLKYLPHPHDVDVWGYTASVYYLLTQEGYNRAIMEIETSSMKDREVAKRIDSRKNEIARIYTEFERGNLVNPLIAGINPEVTDCGYGSRSIANVARVRALRYQLHKQYPTKPNTINRVNQTYRHDYETCMGNLDGKNLPKNWRRKLDKQTEKSLFIKEMIEFSEHMHGNIEQDTVNESVVRCFEEVFPDYLPKNMKRLLKGDICRQTKFIDGNVI